ncbi:hypothetical protein [Halorubrum halophilum]|uniref:hypothetical protein n=1 Tax=Halorubrum halophilum TaxID=413816 RepID=UPI0012AB3ED7|nr:hypothetical protein [Halorubrum halophilum]
MQEHNSPADKSIVEVLNFSADRAKSVLENIVDRREVLIPAECECKASSYNNNYDCQQVVEVARAGAHAVLHATVECKDSPPFRVSGFACFAYFEVDR